MHEIAEAKRRAASRALGFNVLSTAAKLVAAVVTGSVSLLSEAFHSASDIVSSALAYVAIRAASAPPDEEHQFGHGKIESLTGFGESVLLLGTSVYVAVESIRKLFVPEPIESMPLALGVMAASSAGALMVGLNARRVSRETGSLALLANSQHLFVDFYTSVAVLIGLLTVWLTGWTWADAVLGLGLAVMMAIASIRLSYQAFHELIDARLPESELQSIRALVTSEPNILGFHRLRSRRSGTLRYVEMHIVLPRDWSLVAAHEVADKLEREIARELAPASVIIHVDPFEPNPKAQD